MNKSGIVFPDKGLEGDLIIADLKKLKSNDAPWRNGRMFGYIYHASDRESNVIEQAYHMFCNENALNPSLFNSLRQLENETVAMVADLLHAGEGFAGNMTTGGSESILVSVKTENDWARKHRPEIREPEIIAPVTIHPAFSKAADLTGVRAMSRLLPVKWFRKITSRFTGSPDKADKSPSTTGAAAYGMMVAIDNRENVDEIMLSVLDKLYSV